jgi:excisionase family DNA binding protein
VKESEHDVQIGSADIQIHEHDALSHPCQDQAKITGHDTFADSTFAGRYRNNRRHREWSVIDMRRIGRPASATHTAHLLVKHLPCPCAALDSGGIAFPDHVCADKPALKFFCGKADMAFDMNNALLAPTNTPADGDAGLEGHILTVAEVAHFLRVPKSTVYKLARLGQIPASKIGKHWRFLRKDLQHWMQCRSNGQ